MENAKRRARLELLFLLLLLVLGWAIRLYDLDEPPLDFHPTRQLFSALKARGIYYAAHPQLLPPWQLEFALQQSRELPTIEPEILEHLVAWTYTFSGEHLWVARLYSSFFWVAGGFFLWHLVRRRFSPGAAFLSLALYLFLPYAVIASRSFQPDPLMVAALVAFWCALDRWLETPSWRNTLTAALGGGLAILVKFPAAFFAYPPLLGGLILPPYRHRLRQKETIALGVLMALPAALYLSYGLWAGFLDQQFNGRFFPQLWLQPLTYLQWMQEAQRVAGVGGIALGLLGLTLLFSPIPRHLPSFFPALILSLWSGYLLYGFTFTHHITTHDYYHLPLIPLMALSAASLLDRVLIALRPHFQFPPLQAALALIVLYALFGTLWGLRAQMKAVDYRPQAAMWAEIGEKLGHRAGVLALTADYGLSLAYWGWQPSQAWPTAADLAYRQQRNERFNPQALFAEMSAGKRYFLVTEFAELRRQPFLEAYLQTLPLFAQGEGYRIYLLQPQE
jgi:hypothetical protein